VFESFGASPITKGMFGDKNVEKFAFDLRASEKQKNHHKSLLPPLQHHSFRGATTTTTTTPPTVLTLSQQRQQQRELVSNDSFSFEVRKNFNEVHIIHELLHLKLKT